MPRYDYHCKNCDKPFVIEASIKDSRDNVVCNACSGSDVYRVFAQVGLTAMPTRGANSLSRSSSSTTSSTATSSSDTSSSDSASESTASADTSSSDSSSSSES